MPYINEHRRAAVDSGSTPMTPGELNYQLTMIVKEYIGNHPTYKQFNDAVGALECCKLELYRRRLAPYEDQKIIQNGDVYL